MAFSVTVKAKESKSVFNFFKKKSKCKIELVKILENCKFYPGKYNEFYILEEGKLSDTSMILYNPEKIGRGIFFDFSEIGKNEISVSCNLPTTPSEIKDLFSIVREVKSQCGDIQIYVEDEKQNEDEFFNLIDSLIEKSFESLKEACLNNRDYKLIQTLARFPYIFTDEQRDKFANASDLNEYEELLHNVQKMDVYYAKPSLRQAPHNNDIIACYALTSNCESIFPVKGDIFLNFDNHKISDSYISFVIGEEKKLIGGVYKFDDFIKYVLDNGAEYFDADHIIIKEMSKDEIIKMLESLREVKL